MDAEEDRRSIEGDRNCQSMLTAPNAIGYGACWIKFDSSQGIVSVRGILGMNFWVNYFA